jgi:outer membrane receptor protein involved in Fe transport
MNIRLGYSTSLARPELRELTNIYEFDPFQFAVIGGNPLLKNQLTKSYDLRWEWFTGPGEVISASAFTKLIQNPLQRVFIYTSQGNQSTAPEFPLIVYQNDINDGHVYGVELELRRDLGKLWAPFKYLFFGANLLLDISSIDKNPERLDQSRINDRRSPATSPVFEQAPYSINAYLDYTNTRSGTTVTASFNMVGARLIQVQLDGTPDLYDRPTPTLDLVFSQRLGKRWVVKGFAKNIIDPAYKQVYTNPGNHGKFHGTEYIYRQYNKGREVSLGLTYKLF